MALRLHQIKVSIHGFSNADKTAESGCASPCVCIKSLSMNTSQGLSEDKIMGSLNTARGQHQGKVSVHTYVARAVCGQMRRVVHGTLNERWLIPCQDCCRKWQQVDGRRWRRREGWGCWVGCVRLCASMHL